MIALEKIKSAYFIGIGGIGMSALALYCKQRGISASGYDKTPSEITERLQRDGINVVFDDDESLAPKQIDLVVFTPAVPYDHPQLIYYQSNGYQVVKRSDLLQAVTDHVKTIAVAGTHGKTTTSTLIAHILEHSGYGCTAFLGGVAVNYNSNYWSSNTNVIVTEADEYDRSFLKLNPEIAVITSCDPDHLDIYGTHEAIVVSYNEFANKVKANGLVMKFGLELNPTKSFSTYSVDNEKANAHASQINLVNGYYTFDWQMNNIIVENIHLPIPGRHNVENCVAAIAVTTMLGIPSDKIKLAVESFRGVKRRFEIIFDKRDVTYVDDYAHHPKEIEAFLKALKTFRPNKKITCVFQPHLYSRTRDFAEGFSKSLSIADEVILMPIYPAREEPIEGVDSAMIERMMKNEMTGKSKKILLLDAKDVLTYVEKNDVEVLCTVGAGDIDRLINPINEILNHRYSKS